jgi:pimeloyl-ACP methyl ester carboxylesterase
VSDFTEHTVDLASGPVAYRKGGSGPPILHLHSAAGPRLSPAIEALAGRHTIVMPTTPGFNGTAAHPSVSTMPALADLMAALARKTVGGPCDVIGESFGGWVGLWLAARHPDLVGQLVLEAPAGLRTEGVGGIPIDPEERFRKLYAVPERAPKETPGSQTLWKNLSAMQSYHAGITPDQALLAALPQIRARTLILFGTQDEVIPIEVGRRLQAGIAQSHLSYIYGAAHALEFDQPQRVARLVGAFLERGEGFLVRQSDATYGAAS